MPKYKTKPVGSQHTWAMTPPNRNAYNSTLQLRHPLTFSLKYLFGRCSWLSLLFPRELREIRLLPGESADIFSRVLCYSRPCPPAKFSRELIEAFSLPSLLLGTVGRYVKPIVSTRNCRAGWKWNRFRSMSLAGGTFSRSHNVFFFVATHK